MRTTIDLPADLHARAKALAHDSGWTLSETIETLMRRALGDRGGPQIGEDPTSGLPIVWLGTAVSAEDVRALDDDV